MPHITNHPNHPRATAAERFKILAQSNGVHVKPVAADEVLITWDPGQEPQAHSRCTHALAMMRASAAMRPIHGTDTFLIKLVFVP